MVYASDYRTIYLTDKMRDWARSKMGGIKFDSRRALNKFGSEKRRTYYGLLGQAAGKSFFNSDQDADTFDYDLEYRGGLIEFKSVSCKFCPKTEYLATVNSSRDDGIRRQSADFYVFSRVKNEQDICWIAGYMACSEFFDKGRYVPKGTSPAPGIEFSKANAWVIEIFKLFPVRELKDLLDSQKMKQPSLFD